jgi:hypothetical protein
MILGTDFRFSNVYNTDTSAIELLTEAYKGVIFRFTNVGVRENDDGTATLRFSYEILSPGKFKEEKLRDDQYFEQHLGLILNTLILDIVELESADRESYTEESVDERIVHSEDSTVSEK